MDSQQNENLVNLSVRLTPRQKRLIEYAMTQLGFVSLSGFLLNSAIERARKLINELKSKQMIAG